MSKDFTHFVTHLECSLTGERYEAGRLHNLSKAGKPLLVRYDLERLARSVSKEQLAARAEGMWRYREFLPVQRDEKIVSLGEVRTPLVECPELARRLGARRIIIKDESRLPTGSFKARGLAMAVTMGLPEYPALYLPVFHAFPLWMACMGVTILRSGIAFGAEAGARASAAPVAARA